MKYLNYLLVKFVRLFILLTKIPMFFIAHYFRVRIREVVYSRMSSNIFASKHIVNATDTSIELASGTINRVPTNIVTHKLYYLLWLYLDDTCSGDGYNEYVITNRYMDGVDTPSDIKYYVEKYKLGRSGELYNFAHLGNKLYEVNNKLTKFQKLELMLYTMYKISNDNFANNHELTIDKNKIFTIRKFGRTWGWELHTIDKIGSDNIYKII